MELEEAINICKAIKKNIRCESKFNLNILKLNHNNEEAISTVLQALDNSIPKEKVKEKIGKLQYLINNGETDYSNIDFEYQIDILEKLIEE